jgi:hypothetical protein
VPVPPGIEPLLASPELAPYDYALVRIVPRPERGEFINAGVILHCPARRFLAARIHFDASRVAALWPDADTDRLRDNVDVIPGICLGQRDLGPIAALSQRERFHWLVAPRSAAIQVSPVHCGLSVDPESALDRIFRQLVADVPQSEAGGTR